MSQIISIGLTRESDATIERRAQRPVQLRTALGKKLGQGAAETESHIKANLLSGTYTGEPRGGQTPVALRSGTMRQSVVSGKDDELTAFVGVVSGPASRYAPTILGDGKTTITPKRGKYLAIPIADGLTASGQPRFPGGPRSVPKLQIFESKAGNVVGFQPTGGTFKRGGRKGRQKGRLLFVFKTSVTITGTDALAKGVQQKRARIGELLLEALIGTLEGGAS